MVIPIFIIVHDRINVLKSSIKSFEEQIKTPIKIILHDVASTYSPCKKYLKEMEENGYTVFRHPVNDHTSVQNTIKKYLRQNPDCQYYVITDPDIELDNVNGDILDFYIWLCKKNNNKLVIGPMLRIDDIPDYYSKKELAIKRHKAQFWNTKPTPIKWNDNEYNIQYSPIDTTFQLCHRNMHYNFPRRGIRCYSPYSARHLDWYINPENLTKDQLYYSKHSSNIAHWGRNIFNTDFS